MCALVPRLQIFFLGAGQRIGGCESKTEEVVELIGLKDRHARLAGVLTYAEQRALEIGVTIAGGAKAILLDEPTAGMSLSERNDAGFG